MATIREVNDYYKITVSLGSDSEGKKIRKSTNYWPKAPKTSPVKRRREVEAFAHDFESRIRNGEYLDGENITFDRFVEKWKTDYAQANITQSVLEGYERDLKARVLPEIGYMKLAMVTPLHLQAIYNKMTAAGLSPATVHRLHALISGIFKCAYKWGLVKENPCARCTLPKMEKSEKMQCFDVDQTERFLQALTLPYEHTVKAHTNIDDTGKPYQVPEYKQSLRISPQLVAYFNLAIYTGCRRGELIALHWSDIDYKANTVTISKAAAKTKEGQIVKVPKTSAGNRTVTVPASCIQLLKEWKRQQRELSMSMGDAWQGFRGWEYDNNFVFIQDNGSMMNLDTPSHRFKEIITAYNAQYVTEEKDRLPLIRLHDLRHTNATLLIAHGTDPRTVSQRLGHSKTSVTLDIYSHALKAKDQEAANTLGDLLSGNG